MVKKKENKILKYIKEHKIIIGIISIILVLIISGTSLAIYLISNEGEEKSYTLGNIDVEYIDGQIIKAENSIPLADYEIEEYAAKKEFSFKNTGNITMYAEILLTDIEISNNLISNDFRWELYEENDSEKETYSKIAEGTFIKINDNKISLKRGIRVEVGATSKKYRILVYIKDNEDNQNEMMTTNMSCKVTVRATDKPTLYEDNSGANPPKLADGMIPVTYDEEKNVWVKANTMKKWYDYDKQWWANAVTVSTEVSSCEDDDTCVDSFTKRSRSEYMNAKAGTEISMDDINSMWVWIPRYKYRIPDHIGIGTATPPEIDVVFETGLSATGVTEERYRNSITEDGTVPEGIYYTHPAFRDGSTIYNEEQYDKSGWDSELTGMWVGKFETGTSDELCSKSPNRTNCKDVEPIIKPNVKPIKAIAIQDQFISALKFAGGLINEPDGKIIFSGNNDYGLTNKIDTHVIKSTEWGAVAYLSQSKYGKMGNPNYEGADKEIYRNDAGRGAFTGRSAGCGGCGEFPSYGTYSYNGYTCTDEKCITGDRNEDTILKGIGASTTGTIYGIYDMNGGNYENSLGYRGSDKSLGFETAPERKYYDLYKETITKDTSILGDATWETDRWYKDHYDFSGIGYWTSRSGNYGLTSQEGAFLCFWGDGGDGGPGSTNYSDLYSFRTVLIP